MPIYWLNGDKAADEYEDFYDETWDEEASMRDESGNTVSAPDPVWTGCEHDGTEGFSGGGSVALGSNRGVVFGVPNSDATNAGPLSGNSSSFGGVVRPFYGLSGVFSVSPPGEILYSATLTVGEETFLDTYLGYHSGSNQGSLHPVTFTYAGSSVGVFELSYLVGGDLVLDVTTPGASLLGSGSFNLYLDGAAFLIEDPASDSDGEFEFSDHGLSWTNGQIVRVWLTENREPKLTISGTTLVGQTLTATIDEPDGLPPSDQITYQWIRVDGNTESDISGETGSTYTLVDADEDKTIKVEASYTDNANFAESLTSDASAVISSGPSVGTVTSGMITQTSAVITVTISNPDTNSQTVNLQYKRNADTNWTSGGTRSTVSAAVTFTLSSLTGNTDYDVRASLDSTFASDVVTATFKTSPVKPAPPTGVDITTEGNGELTVGWTAPTENGGSDITGYKVQWKSGAQSFGSSRQHTTADGAATSYTIPSLTNGTEYTVRVLAVNSVGDSAASNTDTGTPSTTPSDPTNVQASGNAELVVTWTAPDDGGSAITGYTVQWKSGSESYSTTRQATVTTTTHTIPTLTNGTTYTLRVKATNANGDSDWTETTGTPASGPSVGTVTSGMITKTSAVITVTIANPDTNTQTVNLQYKRNADTNWTSGGARSTVSAAVTFTLSSLTGNTDYDVRASLDSTFASGVKTASFTTSPTKPGQTWGVNVTFKGNGVLAMGWQAPQNDGGSAITGYKVQWKSGSQSFGDPSREHTTTGASVTAYIITGLTNGTEYTVRVIAVNAFGDGPPSSEKTATPVGPPDAPPNVQASGNAELTVTWDAPNDGGSGITGYTVQLKLSSISGWPSGSVTERTLTGTPPARSHTFTGLTNGTEYTVRVKATNIHGDSDWSDEAGGTPSSKPPPSVTITTGADQPIDGPFAVTITFNEEVEGFACADEPPDPIEVACDIGAGYVGGALVDVVDLQEVGVNANGEHVFTARVEDILTGRLVVWVHKGKARAVDGGLPNAFGALQVEVKALDQVPQQPVTTVWQASMDVEDVGGYLGYAKAGGHSGGSLTGDTFSWSGQEYTVETLLYNQAIGEVILELSRALPNDGRRMALLIGNYWLDTSNPEPYTHTVAGKDGWGYKWHPVAPYLEAGHANVSVKLVRQAIGASSAQGEAFLSWGDPGDDTITGYRIERRDRDGDEGFTALVDDTGSDDTGYTDRSVEGGGRYAYRVTAMNDAGESEPSGETHVDVPARPNSPARRAPTISGTAQVGETLTADTDGIEDDDGLADAVYSYQWLADDADISGATSDTYTLVADDVGKAIKVKVSFRDDRNHEESLTSEATAAVTAATDDSFIWSATLTVGSIGGFRGFWKDVGMGELTSEVFTLDGVDYTVKVLADSDGPQFYLTLDKALPVGFTLQVGATTLSSQDASIREFSSGATQYGWATNQEAVLADVDTVEVSLTLAE